MGTKHKKGIGLIVGLGIIGAAAVIVSFFSRHNLAVFEPRGAIAHSERNLMFLALGLCAIVVIPVFTLTAAIALKYREGNKQSKKYSPDWDSDRRIELTWWAIPGAIITILAIATWISSYSLDPYRALASPVKPLNIQVVALDWKWLFIYPDQNVATVNYVRFPINTPVSFHITSDSVMNSFWVPNLGGQIYAMPGMDTQLHLEASQAGSYPGSSANISGRGFASMHFTADATSYDNFNNWVGSLRRSAPKLTVASYEKLAQPGTSPVAHYSSAEKGLYDWVIVKYMVPGALVTSPGSTPPQTDNRTKGLL